MIKTLLAAFAPAALLVAGPALAAPSADAKVVVAYADLNLARADHREMLDKRLDRAAQNACERPFIRDLGAMAAFGECVAAASAEARARLAAHSAAPALASR